MWMVVNCKNGVSSYEIARDLGVTQKTAWFMLHRLRLAIHANSFDKMSGDIEIDETYIGGRSRNKSASKKARVLGGKRAALRVRRLSGVDWTAKANTLRFALAGAERPAPWPHPARSAEARRARFGHLH